MALKTLTHTLSAKSTVVLATMQPDPNTFVMPLPEDWLQVRNVSLKPLEHSTIELNEVCNQLGSKLKTLSAQHVKLDFEVLFRGSGVVGTAPNCADLLKMSGLGEELITTTGSEQARYTPIDKDFKCGSLVVFLSGNKHALMGAQGKVTCDWKTNDFAMFKFEITGLYIDPSYEEGPATPCYEPPMPKEVNYSNTTWSLHGVTTSLYSLSIDVGTNPTFLDLPGFQGVKTTTREASGSIEIAAARIDEHDWFTVIRNQETGPLIATHGTTPGNIVECVCDNVQLLQPTYGEQNEERTNSFNLNIMPAPGADKHEIGFIFR